MNTPKNLFAVIGNPINHSLSPQVHLAFAQQCHISLSYEKILGEEKQFEEQVKDFFSKGGKGLNITMPFKERTYYLADISSPAAKAAKAANTLWMKAGELQADNTDGAGFIADVSRYVSLKNSRIVILGAGGAARGLILPILKAQPRSLVVANRSLAKAQALQKDFPEITILSLADLSENCDLVINATSIRAPTNLDHFPKLQKNSFCYDLSYDQNFPTPFVAYAKNFGCNAIDGLGMLVEQAAVAFTIWHGLKPETGIIIKKLRGC